MQLSVVVGVVVVVKTCRKKHDLFSWPLVGNFIVSCVFVIFFFRILVHHP